MEKFEWYAFLKLPKTRRSCFIGTVVDNDNMVYAFVSGEEKKYKAAVKKQEKKEV